MKSNTRIILDALQSGPKDLTQLAEALLQEGKRSSRYLAGIAIRNARRPNYHGATIVALGKGRYVLVSPGVPEGVRFLNDVWQIRGKTRWLPVPNCRTAKEAAQLREQMKKGGVL